MVIKSEMPRSLFIKVRKGKKRDLYQYEHRGVPTNMKVSFNLTKKNNLVVLTSYLLQAVFFLSKYDAMT